MKSDAYGEVPLTLATALVPWAGLVAAGTQAGVFVRLPVEVCLALAAFAALFAASVVLVDARVRGWLATRAAASAWTAALGTAVMLVAGGAGLSGGRGIGIAAMTWAPVLVFVFPLSVAAAVAAAAAAWRWRAARPGNALEAAGD
jgi:hypothetical protein